MTTYAKQIVITHAEHPEWSSKEIAIHLNASWGHVRTTLYRHHLCVPSTFLRRRLVPGLGDARPRP